MKPIDINPHDLEEVQKILATYVPDREVWAFGSRVAWTTKDFSDLDLAIIGDAPLPIRVLGDLADAFRESDLPFKVDVLDWTTTSPTFRQIIQQEYAVVQDGTCAQLPAIDNWRTVSVDEIKAKSGNAAATGPFGSSISSRFFRDEGVPVIRGSNLSENVGTRLSEDGLAFLDPEKAHEFSRSKARRGDLVFTCWGTVNQIGLIDARAAYSEYIVSNKQMKLTPDPGQVDSLFLYYAFSAPELQERIKSQAIGSSVPGFNLGQLKALELDLPPLPEQRAIARILGALDDKIELNRRMNETLEAMARALFKSWFVDFDPVRAKAEGRDPGLPSHLAALFPDSFEDSELGETPTGWRVGCVDDEFDLTMGQSPPGDTYNQIGEGAPFFQGCADFGFRFPTRRVFCTAPSRLANTGDTLISVRAPVGDINMASEGCGIGRGVAAARHKTGSRSYSFQFMRSLAGVFARFNAEGTVFGSISKRDFHAIPCVLPPYDVIAAFERCLLPIDSRVETNERESRALAELRDALLPKLISGQLRVPDAERLARSIA